MAVNIYPSTVSEAEVVRSGSVNIYPQPITGSSTPVTSTFQPTASIASVTALRDQVLALETTTATLSTDVTSAKTTAESAQSLAQIAAATVSLPKTIDVSDQITGSNMLFSAGVQFVQDSLAVYYNGQRLRNPAEFSEDRSSSVHKAQLTFTPDVGDSLILVCSSL